MKKWLKITLISVGSLLGAILLVVVVACWLIFTPSRLTSIVNSLTEKYIECETHFDKIDLTLFKTFPNAGIEISDFYVVNPVEGAPSDTLAHVGTLTVGVNLMEYLSRGNILVRQVCLDNTDANVFIDAEGNNNFTIFPPSTDTTESEPFQMPDEIDISRVSINNLNCNYIDLQHDMQASVAGLDLSLAASLQETKTGKGDLKLDISQVDFQRKDSAQATMNVALGKLLLTISGSVKDLESGNASMKLEVESVAYQQFDAEKKEQMAAALHNLAAKINGRGDIHKVDGTIKMTLPKADFAMKGDQYVNEALASSTYDLFSVNLPFSANIDSMSFDLQKSEVSLDRLLLSLNGVVALKQEQRPMQVAIDYATNKVSIGDFLPFVPAQYASMLKGMNVDASLALDGHAEGLVAGDTLPVVTCNLVLSDGRFSHTAMPVDVKAVNADLAANVDLSKQTPSTVVIKTLQAAYRHNKLNMNGRVDDLMGNMRISANLKGDVVLSEIMPLLPDSLKMDATGTAKIDLTAKASMNQITSMDLKKMKVNGTIAVANLDMNYDSIHVSSPAVQMGVTLPSTQNRLKTSELAEVSIACGQMAVQMPATKTDITLKNANISAGVSDVLDKKQPFATALKVAIGNTEVHYDTIGAVVEDLKFNGNVRHDSTKTNVFYQWNPQLNVAFSRTSVFMPQMPEAVRLASFQFNYQVGHCEIAEADIHWGLSDYHLSGTVNNLEDWLDHTKPLSAKVNFNSNYTDVDQIMALVSGMGSNPDTLEAMRKEDHVDEEANPFIVPLDVDIDFNTNIKRCIALGNDLSNLSGGISVRNGKVILDQVGFACRAARMQLTGIYKSPRPNHLYLGVDFHLLDIQINELIDMVPFVDTLFPMLSAFDGQGNFHLALETYLDAKYQPKVSTLLGSTAISGKDLVVLPGETFNTMAKYLMFNKKTENKIDSLDVEATLFRNRIDVYPFLLSMDKYQVCVSGIHSLDNACNYHLELLKSPLPMRLAIDVTGSLSKPNIALGKVKYNDLFNPQKTDAIKTRTLEIKKMVREALEGNVR